MNEVKIQHRRAAIRWSPRLAAVLGGLIILAGMSAATPRKAEAAVVQGYGVSMQTACMEQHPGANVAWWWYYYSPYSWYCGNYTTPTSFNYMGGVNVQAYCTRHFPGTYAKLSYVGVPTVWSWVCA
jgi:hypothetical protein